MNDLEISVGNIVLELEIQMYNQIFISDYATFLKLIMKLKELAGDKIDEHYKDKYTGTVLLNNYRLNSKNSLVIDLNDFSKIIENLTFTKTSLLRKIYLHLLNVEIDEVEYDKCIDQLEEIFKVDEKIKFDLKTVPKEKLLDLLFSLYTEGENEYINKPNRLVDIIIDYLNINNTMKCIAIIDSSIKIFDYQRLIDDERIYVLDTCIDLNENSGNILVIDNLHIDTINLEDLINKIELHWPVRIYSDDIRTLLNLYFRIIMNDDIEVLNNPSDTFVALYIIIRKMLQKPLTKIDKYQKDNSQIVSFIEDNMV